MSNAIWHGVRAFIGVVVLCVITPALSMAQDPCNIVRDYPPNPYIDSRPLLQSCIDSKPAGAVVDLHPGVYNLYSGIDLVRPVLLRTRDTAGTPRCGYTAGHKCAELKAAPDFYDPLGIIYGRGEGIHIDHIVVNGNLFARNAWNQEACSERIPGVIKPGYNIMLFQMKNASITNSASAFALCGSGLFVAKGSSDMTIVNNIIAKNGTHMASRQKRWADGMTIVEADRSHIAYNELFNNTDVSFSFGGCRGCNVHHNLVWHDQDVARGSFAAMLIHAYPDGKSHGDYTGARFWGNIVDCGPNKNCGFGINIGAAPWYPATPTTGGRVDLNLVVNARQGININHDVRYMTVLNNNIAASGGVFPTGCGVRAHSAYDISPWVGPITVAPDYVFPTSQITRSNWSGCIPNPAQ